MRGRSTTAATQGQSLLIQDQQLIDVLAFHRHSKPLDRTVKKKQVSRPKSCVTNPGQARGSCGGTPRVRLPLPRLPRWMLQREEAPRRQRITTA
ncbi:hypothetical protein VZT92_012689 [Zoarces viviparus]|uniref:Uncharacterized protein n=1 Tax=Zoarces viviparus TaxID=48416 RepID=A0AAW1F1Y9_ZOAVI